MSSMDKLLPQISSTPVTNPITTPTQWDLPMDANQTLFPFGSLPSWSNYPPLLLPPPPPIIHHPSSSSLAPPRIINKQMETLIELEDDDQLPEDRDGDGDEDEELGAMKEMMYKIAAMQPVEIDPATIRKPKRRNVRISDDPQSVAARLRRERISEKIRILQRLVPGGTKLDTASMLDEAARYVKYLKRLIRRLQHPPPPSAAASTAGAVQDVTGRIHTGDDIYLPFNGGNTRITF